ncbi:MAG: PAS-domain containing protein [Pseudomonadota bacterium]
MLQGPQKRADESTGDTLDFTLAGLNLIQQALSIYDRDLRLVVCNRRFLEMFDLPEHLGRAGAGFGDTLRLLASRGEYGDIADHEAYLASREAQARAFEPHYFERQRPNGQFVSIEGHPLRQGGWVTVYTDISDIRRSEAMLTSRSASLSEALLSRSEALARANRELEASVVALQQTQRELTASEARIRATTEMLPAHIARVSRDQRYTYSNRRLHSIAGLSAGLDPEVVGRRCQDVLVPEAYAAIQPRLVKALAGEESVFEFALDEGTHRVRCAFTPDVGEDGTVSGVFVLTMDVTREARTRAEVAQTRRRELAAQLSSGLAHDFANLLTVILGAQGQLARLSGLPQEAHSLLEDVHLAARRGGELLDRLSGIAAPRTLAPEVTDVPAAVAQLVRLVGPLLPAHIRLVTDIEPGVSHARLDPGYLLDSLLNLVLNARDVIAEQPGDIHLQVRRTREGGLEFSVQDNGPGFSDAALAHALEPFFTTKAATLGSGLGLSMVFDFASLSGGRVLLENVDDDGVPMGARVRIRLPDPVAVRPPVGDVVLLVDDDSEIRANVRQQLQDIGCQVLEAASADEAVQLTGVMTIGAIVSDLQLGSADTGLDLIHRVRVARGDSAPPTCIMTALPAHHALYGQAAELGLVLAKPFDTYQLARALRQIARPLSP